MLVQVNFVIPRIALQSFEEVELILMLEQILFKRTIPFDDLKRFKEGLLDISISTNGVYGDVDKGFGVFQGTEKVEILLWQPFRQGWFVIQEVQDLPALRPESFIGRFVFADFDSDEWVRNGLHDFEQAHAGNSLQGEVGGAVRVGVSGPNNTHRSNFFRDIFLAVHFFQFGFFEDRKQAVFLQNVLEHNAVAILKDIERHDGMWEENRFAKDHDRYHVRNIDVII